MKRLKLIYFVPAILSLCVLSSSCQKDEVQGPLKADAYNIAGEYRSDVVLDSSVVNNLDGVMLIKNGATLTILPGTKILVKGGTVSYIAIARGSKIMVNGTKEKPVIMTSNLEVPGAWGGLVVCGHAPVNTDELRVSEVGSLKYGGDDTEDSSGSIKYLRVEYSGYNYTPEKQFNGISFFGVGAGTMVDYVSSYLANDDGFEFFGGSVVANHLVSIGSQDDGVDFTDGWTGGGSYWYIKDPENSAIEGSNNDRNGAAEPVTNVHISHTTIQGSGYKPWNFFEGAGIQSIDDIVIGAAADGPYFYASESDLSAQERIANGDISITNVLFTDAPETLSALGKASEGIEVGENPNTKGAGNGSAMPEWATGWSMPEK